MSKETIVTVITNNGPVIGRKRANGENKEFYSFQGIPFAKPPIGELRFKVRCEGINLFSVFWVSGIILTVGCEEREFNWLYCYSYYLIEKIFYVKVPKRKLKMHLVYFDYYWLGWPRVLKKIIKRNKIKKYFS